MKTIAPLPRNNQVVILHTLIRFGKTGYQPDDLGLGLEVVSRTGELVAFVHVDHIMPRGPQAQLVAQYTYAAQDPKWVRGALVRGQAMVK